jgi:serine protease Do
MKQYFLKTLGTMVFAGILSTCTLAQQNSNSDKHENHNSNKLDDNEEIVIRKKGDKKSKVTVEIRDGEVMVNGKPLSEFNDENVSIRIENGASSRGYAPGSARSLFRTDGNTMLYNGETRPFLGVMTDDDENGAKITSVTKGSGAEKAGLKAGDVISKVNDTKIENARALTETIGKLKADEKVNITIRRDDKEQKVTATLGKRSSTATVFPSMDMNFDDFRLGTTGAGFGFNRGRLGIKAQDTEDEKGVKVLEVDAESHAAKSGIKEGDIILKFDGEEVNSATELAEAAREAREKNTIPVTISRDGKTQNIDIKIPKKLKTANL